jgi:UDP-2-acetamido-3-amino-2,3-dideoxy-glucuronate N-acetyltransferase
LIATRKAIMAFIHPSAEVEADVSIGDDSKIWHLCHIRRGAHIGSECVIGRGVFVDAGVQIGNRVKIQNYVSVFHGVTIEDGVFVGPHVCFTNDMFPRAINADMSLKAADDWVLSETLVKVGAALGANSTIVPDYALVVGNPAHIIGYVTPEGKRVTTQEEAAQGQ